MSWLLLLVACPHPSDTTDTDVPDVEILDPEPAGAPVDVTDGRLTCVGNNAPTAPVGGAVELTGYVRTLADPGAASAPPAAQIAVFDADGNALGTTFADPSKDGRVAITVPVPDTGFTGWVLVTDVDHLDWRFRTSRPVTSSAVDGWTWLVTPDERDAKAAELGVTPAATDGVLIGVVHDCDGFGVANVIVVVDGDPTGILYTEGFDLSTTRTYTSTSGRFVLPIASGAVTVKAFGRLEASGPLILLSSVESQVDAGAISAVALEPRVSTF